MKFLERSIPWTEDHEVYREMAADFFDKEVAPHHPKWEQDGVVPRQIWEKAGAVGLLCPDFPEKYGGGATDFLYNAIVIEESARVGNSGFAHSLHSDVVAPYLLHHCNEEQKERWLANVVAGKTILAVAMTEPSAGSDLAGIRATAKEQGDHYLLNGQKTFITNGCLSDLVIVVARTDPDKDIHGISLLAVERGMEGFERGQPLKKLGMHAQDTAELFFNDVRIPKENMIGKPGHGFRYLMSELTQERLVLAISNMRSAEVILKDTLEYVKRRQAFGHSIGKFQHIRFRLADMATEQAAARALLDQTLLAHTAAKSNAVQASQVKLLCSEILKRHVDECLQFFGGYGFMMEYPIARAYIDARVQTIYAGTSEVMREIIASSGLGL